MSQLLLREKRGERKTQSFRWKQQIPMNNSAYHLPMVARATFPPSCPFARAFAVAHERANPFLRRVTQTRFRKNCIDVFAVSTRQRGCVTTQERLIRRRVIYKSCLSCFFCKRFATFYLFTHAGKILAFSPDEIYFCT